MTQEILFEASSAEGSQYQSYRPGVRFIIEPVSDQRQTLISDNLYK